MRTIHRAGLALAIATGFALPLAGSAEAAMGGALPSTQVLPVEQAQFIFLNRNFCWYDAGWQGPGWYWCNYAWRSGYGWGGGDGWRGWNRNQWHGDRDHWHGDRGPWRGHGPVMHPMHQGPANNTVRPPQVHGGGAPQIGGGAVYEQKKN